MLSQQLGECDRLLRYQTLLGFGAMIASKRADGWKCAADALSQDGAPTSSMSSRPGAQVSGHALLTRARADECIVAARSICAARTTGG